MSAFKEHFLDKYFGYRRRYVDHILREAPSRASLAVLSEIARLSFVLAGSALCALILWLLTAGAAARNGPGLGPTVFGLLAFFASLLGAFALGGLVAAFGDRARVRQKAGR